jgi:hypothetical protein
MMLIARKVCFCGAVLMASMVVVFDEVSVADFEVVGVITVLHSLVLEFDFVQVSDTVDRCVDFLAAPLS